ncbi:MAG: tetraacyldisaccharide 4'-kinase [Desulfobacteraceae bacterium 4572_88]|nr:MAG: tetraacyldisaccharide 4'-kinase [Desulfobacteraceae bacterium 4572_88]
MSDIRKKIETIIKDGKKSRLFSFASLLFLISLLYSGLVKLRASLYQKGILKTKKLPVKVISVGNLTVGGTGKTPMIIYLANLLNRLGYQLAIVSRGYKGSAEKTGGIVSDGKTLLMGPDAAGDEPCMLAMRLRHIPVLVGQNRFEMGMLAIRKFSPDVILLDDAFQHIRLARDINLILMDHRHPFGNGYLLPRGPLREPISALSRGHALILTRHDPAFSQASPFSFSTPIFRCTHAPHIFKVIRGKDTKQSPFPKDSLLQEPDASFLKGQNAFAFSGIARNSDFRDTIKHFGCNLCGFSEYPDHHPYSADDLANISCLAGESGADVLMTTEKDYARIPSDITWPMDLVVIGISISFGGDEKAFTHFIKHSTH